MSGVALPATAAELIDGVIAHVVLALVTDHARSGR
jgi:hypothetical protein